VHLVKLGPPGWQVLLARAECLGQQGYQVRLVRLAAKGRPVLRVFPVQQGLLEVPEVPERPEVPELQEVQDLLEVVARRDPVER